MAQFGKSTNVSRTMSIGGKGTTHAMDKASATSIGNKQTRTTEPTQTSSIDAARAQRPMSGRSYVGSRAGLNDEKSVHLQMNNSGYLNPNHQIARHGPKRPLPKPIINVDRLRSDIKPAYFDSRLSASSLSSVSRLAKLRLG